MEANKLENYLSLVKKYFYDWPGIIAIIIFVTLFFLRSYEFFTAIFSKMVVAISYFVVLLIIVVVRYFMRKHIPKNEKGKIGITVGLYCDEDLESIGIRNDLVDQLNKNLRNDNLTEIINVIKLPNHHSKNIESFKKALEFNSKVGGHYFIFGKIKRRPDGEQKVFIEISGLVTHAPIAHELSQRLSGEFSKTLPVEVEFLDAFRFRGFQFSADLIYLSAQYIIGIAAYMSGDVNIAVKLHRTLLGNKILSQEKLPPNLIDVKSKLNNLLAEEYSLLDRRAFLLNNLLDYQKYAKLSAQLNNNTYGLHMIKAIEIFVQKKDAVKALDEINKAKVVANGAQEWRYSQAFLLFWLENYEEAYKSAKKITEHEYPWEDRTLEEVETFNLNLLKEFADKNQLYFWLGFLKYKKQHNLSKALEYFTKFKKDLKKGQEYLSERLGEYKRLIKEESKEKLRLR